MTLVGGDRGDEIDSVLGRDCLVRLGVEDKGSGRPPSLRRASILLCSSSINFLFFDGTFVAIASAGFTATEIASSCWLLFPWEVVACPLEILPKPAMPFCALRRDDIASATAVTFRFLAGGIVFRERRCD